MTTDAAAAASTSAPAAAAATPAAAPPAGAGPPPADAAAPPADAAMPFPMPTDGDSLNNLIKHCQELGEQRKDLKHQNEELAQLVERLKTMITDMNLSSSVKELEDVVQPWLKEVGIEDKDIQVILDGALAAQKKIINRDLVSKDGKPSEQKNHVIEVMCNAAAVHGRQVAELEKQRSEIADLQRKIQNRNDIEAAISSGDTSSLSRRESVLGKRPECEAPSGGLPGEEMSSTECWSQLFSTVGRGR